MPQADEPVDPCIIHNCTIGPMLLGKCACESKAMTALKALVTRRGSPHAIQIIWCSECHRRIAGYVKRLDQRGGGGKSEV